MTRIDVLTPLTFPFVGRQHELTVLGEFGRSAATSGELRALLVTGEAGIGKSRLIEAATIDAVTAGGAVVHVRFYEGSSEDSETLLRHALQVPGRGVPPAVLSALDGNLRPIAALRRVARLRVTLLVLEDLDQVDGSGARGLAEMLRAIAAEPIALVCAARPGGFPARAAIEPYLAGELTIPGLTPSECEQLWSAAMPSGDDTAPATELHELTGGNPLAVRAAIRGLISRVPTARLERPAGGGRSSADLIATLGRTVELVADGMLLGLDEQDLDAARALSVLGEVFGRSAASVLLDRADEHIDALVSAGVLYVPPIGVTPLVGSGETAPLGFSHTLVHRRLLRSCTADARRLRDVLASTAPVYSSQPFTWLAEHVDELPPVAGPAAELVRACVLACVDLFNRREHAATASLWSCADAVLRRFAPELSPDVSLELEADVLWVRLLVVLNRDPDAQTAAAEAILERTQHTTNCAMAGARVRALARLAMSDPRGLESRAAEIDELLDRFPELHGTGAHIFSVRALAQACGGRTEISLYRDIERRVTDVLSSCTLEGMAREELLTAAAMLLFVFTTPAELEQRLALVEELQKHSSELARRTTPPHVCLRIEIGELATAAALAREQVAANERLGVPRNYQTELYIRYITWISGNPEESIPDAERYLGSIPEPFWQTRLRGQVGMYLCQILLLQNRPDLAAIASRTYDHDVRGHSPDRWVLLRAAGHELVPREELDWRGDSHRRMLGALEAYARGESLSDMTDVVRCVEAELADEPMHLWDRLLRLHATGALIDAADGTDGGSLRAALAPRLRAVVVDMLEWLCDPRRSITSFATALLDRFVWLLDEPSVDRWRQRIARCARAGTGVGGGADVVSLRMVGVVAVRRGDEPSQRVQGARMRALLAAMTASAVLGRPIGQEEFYRIAVGEDAERESARNIVKTTVRRLRNVIGDDAVCTDGDTPTLNLALVRVDLLDALAALDAVRVDVARGALALASDRCRSALETLGGEAAFPGCYDDVFESLRSDIDVRVRSAVLDLARALLREGDAAAAAEILDRGIATLPGDEELEQLRSTPATPARAQR